MVRWVGGFFLVAILIGCENQDKGNLRIAVAANVRPAIEQIAREFTNTTGHNVEIISSSSGKLTTQILQGAPYDVFISADMDYPREIFESGFAAGRPRPYAIGKLILWSVSKDSISLDDLGRFSTIALPNPELAPFGKAARAVIDNLGNPDLSLVFGENVSQTNHFILSGSVDAGFTARSTVMVKDFKKTGVWIEIPDSLYAPIVQGLVIIRGRPNQKIANEFVSFLQSDVSQNLLTLNGYSLP